MGGRAEKLICISPFNKINLFCHEPAEDQLPSGNIVTSVIIIVYNGHT